MNNLLPKRSTILAVQFGASMRAATMPDRSHSIDRLTIIPAFINRAARAARDGALHREILL
jgi:hypothetical protein